MKESGFKVELLAPAGSPDSFYGAIHAGADAVYLAGSKFGARAYAENFTDERLLECIRYGHLFGRKIYLTVNTLLKDSELEELYEYIQPFYEAGLDAVIVQDLGVFHFLKEHFQGLRLHASTQMTICSGYGASYLKAMGAERVIPARELGLQELISMKRQANIEIEAFIHGAMCYCYSGQCLFSSIAGGRSGNRGRCAQPCRLPYSVDTGQGKSEVCHPLSLKDMCTIEKLPQLIEAGIDSFKIEGRMKKPEYAAGVTHIYRQYIDKYYELREKMGAGKAAESYRVDREDLKILSSLYVRSGLQDGYFFRRNGRSMITLDSPAYKGSDETLLEELRKDYILSPLKLPVSIKAFFQPGQPAAISLQHEEIQASVTGTVVERAQKQPITEANIRKQLGKLGDSSFYAEQIEIETGEDCFYPLKQINELRREAVAALEEQILLTRGYGAKDYEAKDYKAECSFLKPNNKPTLKEQDLNSEKECPTLKEQTLNFDKEYPTLKEKTLNSGIESCTLGKMNSSGTSKGYAVLVSTLEQLKTVSDWLSEEVLEVSLRIYVEGDLARKNWEQTISLCRSLSDKGTLFIVLPYILREEEYEYIEELYAKVISCSFFHGFLVRSMDGLGFLQKKDGEFSLRTDAGVYVWNRSALEQVAAMAEGFCLPYELRASEQLPLLGGLPCEKIVYGRIPMMITANCVLRTMGQCRKGGKKSSFSSLDNFSGLNNASDKQLNTVVLTDRHQRKFPVAVNCAHCVNIIYNTVPFSLYQELAKWRGKADLRLDFTLESAEEVRNVLDSFLKGKPFDLGEYTTGHERRGVE